MCLEEACRFSVFARTAGSVLKTNITVKYYLLNGCHSDALQMYCVLYRLVHFVSLAEVIIVGQHLCHTVLLHPPPIHYLTLQLIMHSSYARGFRAHTVSAHSNLRRLITDSIGFSVLKRVLR